MNARDALVSSLAESLMPVSAQVEAEFAAGLAAGLDPDANQGKEARSSISKAPQRAITTLRSRWLHRLCPTCKHTFRPGDDVLVYAHGEAVHDMPALHNRIHFSHIHNGIVLLYQGSWVK